MFRSLHNFCEKFLGEDRPNRDPNITQSPCEVSDMSRIKRSIVEHELGHLLELGSPDKICSLTHVDQERIDAWDKKVDAFMAETFPPYYRAKINLYSHHMSPDLLSVVPAEYRNIWLRHQMRYANLIDILERVIGRRCSECGGQERIKN